MKIFKKIVDTIKMEFMYGVGFCIIILTICFSTNNISLIYGVFVGLLLPVAYEFYRREL